MTPQEKLHAVETAIRQALPRLKEVSRGCILKNRSNDVWVRLLSDKGNYYEVMSWDTTYKELKKEWLLEYEIIGHDILLSDVLEWLGRFGHKASIHSRAEFVVFVKKREYAFTRYSTYIDLSKPYLKDQSEELINFLYNLLEDN